MFACDTLIDSTFVQSNTKIYQSIYNNPNPDARRDARTSTTLKMTVVSSWQHAGPTKSGDHIEFTIYRLDKNR